MVKSNCNNNMLNLPNFRVKQAYGSQCKTSIKFIEESPEWSPYITKSYMELSAKSNGFADIFVLYDGDKPLLGIPLHKAGRNSFTTGYSGLIFPPRITERQAIRACNLLKKLFEVNKLKAFTIYHQPRGEFSREVSKRNNEITYALSSVFNLNKDLFTRIIYFQKSNHNTINQDLMFKYYQAELRNQIRRARNAGINIEIIDSNIDDVKKMLSLTYDLYNDSRKRTNLRPRPLNDIVEESDNLIRNKFRDIWAVASYDCEIISVVNCHVFNEKAIYNLNYSSELGYKLSANPLALDAAINYCLKIGSLMFETGRFSKYHRSFDSKELAISRYKSQFGGEPIPVIYFHYNKSSIFHVLIAKYILSKIRLLVLKAKNNKFSYKFFDIKI